MNTPVREGETIEGSRTMRNRPYPVLKCSRCMWRHEQHAWGWDQERDCVGPALPRARGHPPANAGAPQAGRDGSRASPQRTYVLNDVNSPWNPMSIGSIPHGTGPHEHPSACRPPLGGCHRHTQGASSPNGGRCTRPRRNRAVSFPPLERGPSVPVPQDLLSSCDRGS